MQVFRTVRFNPAFHFLYGRVGMAFWHFKRRVGLDQDCIDEMAYLNLRLDGGVRTDEAEQRMCHAGSFGCLTAGLNCTCCETLKYGGKFLCGKGCPRYGRGDRGIELYAQTRGRSSGVVSGAMFQPGWYDEETAAWNRNGLYVPELVCESP